MAAGRPERQKLTHSGSRGSPIRDTLPEGFSHFVTSMTAPVASGWSAGRVVLAPTGKRRLTTAHTRSGHMSTMVLGFPFGVGSLRRRAVVTP